MAKKDKEEEFPMGAPMWIVTFTDMISLLLTFFIMLLTFSSMETEKMKQAAGNLAGGFGAMTPDRVRSRPDASKKEKVSNRKASRTGPSDPSIRKDQVSDKLNQIQDRKTFDTKITVEDLRGKKRIKIIPEGNDELYRLGTATLVDRTERILNEIALMFKDLPVRLVVETHIDTEMGNFRKTLTARELTLRMADAAATVLEAAGVAPENCGVSGKGDSFPVADNKTAKGRYKNRRIEILLIPWQEDEILKKHMGGF